MRSHRIVYLDDRIVRLKASLSRFRLFRRWHYLRWYCACGYFAIVERRKK